jgi:hypothetical protein
MCYIEVKYQDRAVRRMDSMESRAWEDDMQRTEDMMSGMIALTAVLFNSDADVYRAYREVPELDFFVSTGSDESLAVRAHSEGPEGPLVRLQVNH